MKKLLWVLFLFGARAIAQMPQADMNITGVTQPIYLSMGGIKSNKVIFIRETAYVVDTITHQANMKAIEKITVYNIAYFGNTALLVKLLAVMGSDTNKLVRSEEYGYDASSGLLKAYKTASSEFVQVGAAAEIYRDANGIITGKSVGVTFDLTKPFRPTDYIVMCSGGTGTNVSSVVLKYKKGGKELMDRINMEYDAQGRLLNSVFTKSDGSSTDKNNISYDNAGRLQEVKWDFTRKTSSYEEDDEEGFPPAGTNIPGTSLYEVKKWESRTSTTTYVYNAAGSIGWVSYTLNGKPASKEVYTYAVSGLPETVKTYNDKGQLIGMKKIICN